MDNATWRDVSVTVNVKVPRELLERLDPPPGHHYLWLLFRRSGQIIPRPEVVWLLFLLLAGCAAPTYICAPARTTDGIAITVCMSLERFNRTLEETRE